MSRRPRRNHTAEFKSKVALAAIRGEKTLSELAEQFDIHPNQIAQWKSQLSEGAASVFGGESKAAPAREPVDVKSLHAKIGALTLESDFLESALTKAGRRWIDRLATSVAPPCTHPVRLVVSGDERTAS